MNTNTVRKLAVASTRKIFMALAVATILTGTTVQAVTIFNLTVPGTAPWYDTGIDIGAGTILNITASGTVIYGPLGAQTTGPNGGNYIDPQLFPDAVLPSTYIVSLIGKIGGTSAVGTGTPVPEGILGKGPGFVGSSYSEIISTGGRLFLGFNDRVPDFGDNSGSFSATVTVPEPSPLALTLVATLVFWTGVRSRKYSAKTAKACR
jgi:hypothetical protein